MHLNRPSCLHPSTLAYQRQAGSGSMKSGNRIVELATFVNLSQPWDARISADTSYAESCTHSFLSCTRSMLELLRRASLRARRSCCFLLEQLDERRMSYLACSLQIILGRHSACTGGDTRFCPNVYVLAACMRWGRGRRCISLTLSYEPFCKVVMAILSTYMERRPACGVSTCKFRRCFRNKPFCHSKLATSARLE